MKAAGQEPLQRRYSNSPGATVSRLSPNPSLGSQWALRKFLIWRKHTGAITGFRPPSVEPLCSPCPCPHHLPPEALPALNCSTQAKPGTLEYCSGDITNHVGIVIYLCLFNLNCQIIETSNVLFIVLYQQSITQTFEYLNIVCFFCLFVFYLPEFLKVHLFLAPLLIILHRLPIAFV